jgi:activator of 2-hydroxyglutaryl-CoA dehydratase
MDTRHGVCGNLLPAACCHFLNLSFPRCGVEVTLVATSHETAERTDHTVSSWCPVFAEHRTVSILGADLTTWKVQDGIRGAAWDFVLGGIRFQVSET